MLLYTSYTPPLKLIPGWRNAPISIRLSAMHVLLAVERKGQFTPFTLRFRDDIASRALKRDSGVCSQLHDRVYAKLSQLGTTHLWQSFERTDDGVIHSHGGFRVEGSASEPELKEALCQAGGEYPPESKARQVHFSIPDIDSIVGWATYARKDVRKSDQIFKGSSYGCSRELRRAAQILFESLRQHLNSHRRIIS